MKQITVTLHMPGESNHELANLERALGLWQEVHIYFAAAERLPFIRDQTQTAFWQIGLDVSDITDGIEAQIAALQIGANADTYSSEPQGYSQPTIRLALVPAGTAHEDEFPHRAIERFLEQLFLAGNLARSGTCNMATLLYEGRRTDSQPSADILDDARYDSDQIGWPFLRQQAFVTCWEWLHEERFYDLDLVTRPSHKALALVLQLCSGQQWQAVNFLLISQALEGLFVSACHKGPKTRLIASRIGEVLHLPSGAVAWFQELYKLRSAFVHGELPLVRSATHVSWLLPEDQEFPHKAEFMEGRGVAILLAVLQELVATNRHDLIDV